MILPRSLAYILIEVIGGQPRLWWISKVFFTNLYGRLWILARHIAFLPLATHKKPFTMMIWQSSPKPHVAVCIIALGGRLPKVSIHIAKLDW
jgi:hypothetical protein